MIKYFLVITFVLTGVFSQAQNIRIQKPCEAPEASQFDFWLGNWDLTWNDTSHGTNHIIKIMDGCAVNENFYDPATKYKGNSWSIYNPNTHIWQQTWIDNLGGYIALTGKFENGTMILASAPHRMANGKDAVSRMVFFNITPDAFDWRWESSSDDGVSWAVNWLIHYKRHK
jgi:hypothetical protein